MHEEEAEQARMIFRRLVELGSILKVMQEVRARLAQQDMDDKGGQGAARQTPRQQFDPRHAPLPYLPAAAIPDDPLPDGAGSVTC